jgi:hypothetical protein
MVLRIIWKIKNIIFFSIKKDFFFYYFTNKIFGYKLYFIS